MMTETLAHNELDPGSHGLKISPLGARVINLPGGILLPLLRNQKGSMRGGIHGCFPYFGPSGPDTESGGPQHGYMRNAQFNIKSRHPHSAKLEIEPSQVPAQYRGLATKISYRYTPGEEAGSGEFSTLLTATNHANISHRLSPGFHPYFAAPNGVVLLDSKERELSDFTGTEFDTADSITLQTLRHEIVVTSQLLTPKFETVPLRRFALWTEFDPGLPPFICIEPTLAGNSFKDSSKPLPGEMLAPGEMRRYGYVIRWLRLEGA